MIFILFGKRRKPRYQRIKKKNKKTFKKVVVSKEKGFIFASAKTLK
jgi:hypothetical protein